MMALEGIRIIDLTRLAPGPYGTMILGDLGAEIIKVERPPLEGGEQLPPPWFAIEDSPDKRVLAHVPWNRNKKSIIINLTTPEGQGIVYRLAKTADIMIEQFRPGVVKRLHVDYETIREINPHIIYCSLSGYGQDGPYSALVGHDINYIALAGAQGMIGTSKDNLAIPMNFLADFAAGGMHAVIGILAALIAREKTGKGQFVDISMFDGVMSLLAEEIARYLVTSTEPEPRKSYINGAAPWYSIYECKDHKFITIGCVETHFWEQLCRVLEREDFIPHQHTEGKKRKEIFSTFREIFRSKTRDEWFEIMRKADDIPVGKVYSLKELLHDPQALHRKMLVEVEHPSFGKIKQVGVSIKLSETPGGIRNTGAHPGKNTNEILCEMGYSESEIKNLKEKGIVMG